jgi:hypothetical protein
VEAAGTPIGANNLLIASQALALHIIGVTDNKREFRRVDGLQDRELVEVDMPKYTTEHRANLVGSDPSARSAFYNAVSARPLICEQL